MPEAFHLQTTSAQLAVASPTARWQGGGGGEVTGWRWHPRPLKALKSATTSHPAASTTWWRASSIRSAMPAEISRAGGPERRATATMFRASDQPFLRVASTR